MPEFLIFARKKKNRICLGNAFLPHMGGGGGSSVASFCYGGGGGGKTPKCTDRKNTLCNLYARAPQIYMYIQVSKYICIHVQSMQWYGTINDSMTDKTLTLRKIYEYASERSERV